MEIQIQMEIQEGEKVAMAMVMEVAGMEMPA